MITFYRYAFLNNEYKDVCTKPFVDAYLNELTKYQVDYDIYLNFYGTIKFSTDVPFAYDYANYMTYDVEINRENKRFYYFITSWDISNGVIIIRYELDYWTTFYGEWNIFRRAFLSYSPTHSSGRQYKIPIEYEMKEIVSATIAPNSLNTRTENFGACLVLTGYFYTLASGGEVNKIQPFCGFANLNAITGNNSIVGLRNQAVQFLADIIENQSKAEPLYYKITNAYLFPSQLISDEFKSYVENGDNITLHTEGSGEATINYQIYNKTQIIPLVIFNTEVTYGMYVMNGEQKLYGVTYGTGKHMYKIPNDGITHSITCQLIIDTNLGFSLTLHGINEVVDITDDFSVSLNFDAVDGSVLAQREANKQYAIMNGVIKAGFGAFGAYKNSYSEMPTSLPEGAFENTFDLSRPARAGMAITSGINEIVYQIKDKFNAFNENTYTYSDAYNTYTGICVYLAEVSNEIEVNTAIDAIGYEVNYFMNTWNNVFTLFPINVDICYIKFSYIDIYGSIPSNAISIIKSILTNGTYIHRGNNG